MDFQKLRWTRNRVSRCREWGLIVLWGLASACSTIPTAPKPDFDFPKEQAFFEEPERPFEVLGAVKSRVDYSTLDPELEGSALCRAYFNKAVKKLVEYAKKSGGDAVMGVKSLVVLMDGRSQTYSRPECFDDGAEGQVLTTGVAIKWKPVAKSDEKKPLRIQEN